MPRGFFDFLRQKFFNFFDSYHNGALDVVAFVVGIVFDEFQPFSTKSQ